MELFIYFFIFAASIVNLKTMMKRIFFSLFVFFMSTALWSQNVLTVCYATSDDGFLNVRALPSSKGMVLTTLPLAFHGLGRGILLEYGKQWSKIRVENTVGWVYTKYMGTQNWYSQNGQPKLVAKKEITSLYTDNYSDEGPKYVPYGFVEKGTIIADEYELLQDGYYVLKTGHDYIFINHDDVDVIP